MSDVKAEGESDGLHPLDTFVYAVGVRVHRSARKHGVADADLLAAVADVRLAVALDDDSPQRQLLLGFDTSTRLLELVVLVFDEDESRWSSMRCPHAASTETYSWRGAER